MCAAAPEPSYIPQPHSNASRDVDQCGQPGWKVSDSSSYGCVARKNELKSTG